MLLQEGDNTLNISFVSVAPPVANLSGVVSDADTGNPISGVKVTIDGLTTYTNASGTYGFVDLEPGNYTIRFEKDGFEIVVR